MRRSTRRLLTIIALLPVLVLLATGAYMVGMRELEGEPRDFFQALEFASETITTTGYGGDSKWQHPVMVLYVVVLQFLGVVMIYMIVPMVLIPVLEERFESRLPRRSGKIEDHVIIFRYGPAVETLIDELRSQDIAMVVVEPEEAVARRLAQRKIPVVFDDVLGTCLDNVYLDRARALITNGSDEENAAVILVARQEGFEGECLALVEEPRYRQPLALAGADAVLTPRHVLGAALAARASRRIDPRLSGIQRLGGHLEVVEIRIDPSSPVAGQTLAEAAIGSRTGATVIGQWTRGIMEADPSPDLRLDPGGVLVAVGTDENLEELQQLVGSRSEPTSSGPFLVAGYGEVGKKVAQLLRDADEPVLVLDREALEGVDLVGDVLDSDLLQGAGIEEARAVVLALDDDRATLFATVILRDLRPELPLVARVNQAENVDRIHRAGADFALSISHVSGMILARRLLGEVAVSIDPGLRVLEIPARKLVRQHQTLEKVRSATGCSVVAVQRGEEVITRLRADFALEGDDRVFVCGSEEITRRFQDLYGDGFSG